jgi:hypothetical protein
LVRFIRGAIGGIRLPTVGAIVAILAGFRDGTESPADIAQHSPSLADLLGVDSARGVQEVAVELI